MGMNPHKKVRSIGFHDTKFPSNALKPLFNYLQYVNPQNLSDLTFSNIDLESNVDDLCAMLKQNTYIKKIKIVQAASWSFSGSELMKALAEHPVLEELHISSSFAPKDIMMGLPGLIGQTKIKKLVLDGLG
jgi:hypothetical protein